MARNEVDRPNHVLSFFNKMQLKAPGSQQRTGHCMFCDIKITSTGATRFLEHLVKCSSVCAEVKARCKKLAQTSQGKRKIKDEVASVTEDEVAMKLAKVKHEKDALKQMGIKSGFRAAEAEVADQAVANFFYGHGISFNAAGDTGPSTLFTKMVRAIQSAPTGWKPPCRKKLAGPLLDTCHSQMQKDLADRDPEGLLAEKFGVAVTSDGWESVDHLPLINSAYITANNGGTYLRSVDTSGELKNAEYCAALMLIDIYSIGVTNVIMVVTDTCSTMRKAWALIEDEIPWICCLPCVPHVVSLLMKDIAKIPEVAKVIADEGKVVTWFSNHHKPLAILRSKVHYSSSPP